MPWESLETRVLEMAEQRSGHEHVLAVWFSLGSDRGAQNYPTAGELFGMVAVCPKVIPTITFCGERTEHRDDRPWRALRTVRWQPVP